MSSSSEESSTLPSFVGYIDSNTDSDHSDLVNFY